MAATTTVKSAYMVKDKTQVSAVGRPKRPFAIDIHAHISDPVLGKFIRETADRTGGGFVTTSGVSKEMIAETVAHYPDRFVGVGTVPMLAARCREDRHQALPSLGKYLPRIPNVEW